MMALTAICLIVISAALLQNHLQAVEARRQAAGFTPPAFPTPTPAPSGPLVSIVGDGSATQPGPGRKAWFQLLAQDVGGRVEVAASDGAGYTVGGTNGATLADAAASVPADTSVIVFVGSASDASSSSVALARAASSAFEAASDRAPVARILVVGPMTRGSATLAQVRSIGRSLRAAARLAGFTYVDPVSNGWLPDEARSGTDLSSADERTISKRLAGLIRRELQ